MEVAVPLEEVVMRLKDLFKKYSISDSSGTAPSFVPEDEDLPVSPPKTAAAKETPVSCVKSQAKSSGLSDEAYNDI